MRRSRIGQNNKQVVKAAKEVGCFFCLQVYPPSNIKYWEDDITASCPLCTKCSVIPKNINDTSGAFAKRLARLKMEVFSGGADECTESN